MLKVHDGYDGARDKVPIGVQRERYHRLELDIILRAVFGGSDVLIEVVLKGNTDQRCDGVLSFFASSTASSARAADGASEMTTIALAALQMLLKVIASPPFRQRFDSIMLSRLSKRTSCALTTECLKAARWHGSPVTLCDRRPLFSESANFLRV